MKKQKKVLKKKKTKVVTTNKEKTNVNNTYFSCYEKDTWEWMNE